ncbi:MAG: Hsp70 family protein [Acidobacteria bacterium]|nr:Hsp70 family protein [Acidobacteriota bacterium]
MKDYWRLIGITNENASDEQIRQAHFRTFRFYQGRKNESKSPAQRAIAELVIDYLRNAQNNPNLQIPNSIKHLLSDPLQSNQESPVVAESLPITSAPRPIPVRTPPKSTNLPQVPHNKPVASINDLPLPPNFTPPMAKPVFAETTKSAVKEEKVPPTEKIASINLPSIVEPSLTSVPPTEKFLIPNIETEVVPKTDDLNKPAISKSNSTDSKPAEVGNWGQLQSLVNQVLTPPDLLVPPTVKITPPTNLEENKIAIEKNFLPNTNISDISKLDPFSTFIADKKHDSIKPINSLENDEDLFLDLDEESNDSSDLSNKDVLPPAKTENPIISQLTSSGQHFVIGNVINCPDCEWDILSQTDSYCSGCGKSITSISVPKELIVYISDKGSYTKSFSITNDGLIPIKIDSFEVIDIDAKVEPNQPTILGKNESLQINLHVSENNTFGRRSGRLKFRYHDKPIDISVQLKEPPEIRLTFPDVPNFRSLSEGFFLRLPISQPVFTCQVETNTENLLSIGSINIGSQFLINNPVQIKNDQPYKLQIPVQEKELNLTIGFQELGSRQFLLKLQVVEVPNIVDQIERYNIGDQAIIIGSGIFSSTLQLKNFFDSITKEGKGTAQNISFSNVPDWLKLTPENISKLGPNENCLITLEIDSNKILEPCRKYLELNLHYYDPQLICERVRPLPIQLTFEFIEPQDYNDWIAIDFGTSNSCAAMIEGTTIRTLLIDPINLNSNPTESPTCIQFVDENTQFYEYGASAFTKRFSGPRALKATAWAFKPLLSKSHETVSQTFLDIKHGKAHTKTVDQLVSIYAHSLIEAIKLRNGITPKKAVITFPVTFGKIQRERLATAFQSVGLAQVITPISEPVALAIHYAYLHREIFSQPGVFAVFDFGGGTTDLAIFHIQPQTSQNKPEFHLLDVSGVDLGGELLTFELARFLYEKLVPINERNIFTFPSNLEDLLSNNSDIVRENYQRLATLAEYIKRHFDPKDQIFNQELTQNLVSSTGSQTFHSDLSLQEIEILLRPYIEQLITILIDMVTALYDRKLIPARRLDWILLGGNSSLLPLVTEMLSEAFFDGSKERVLLDRENIKLGVTKGALLYAVAPEALPFPIDQVNHTLPCRVGLLISGYRFETIFERGITNSDSQSKQEKTLYLPPNTTKIRLYYYFGHESDPKIFGNPKMKEYSINCPSEFSGKDLSIIFELLPESAGIEITVRFEDKEIKETAPILGAG